MGRKIILGVLLLASMAFLACSQSNIDNSENSVSDKRSLEEIIKKPVGPPATPIPCEEWPPIPPPTGPHFEIRIPPPEVSGNVVKLTSGEVSPGQVGTPFLRMFVADGTDTGVGNFSLRITFDPKVIRICQVTGWWGSLYDVKVDNALGVVEVSVNPSAGIPFSRPPGWVELGTLAFTAIGNPGDSTALHLIVTSPVENLTPIDGVVRIKSEN